MIIESGRVVATDTDKLWVETIGASKCSGCSLKSGCGQGLLSGVFGAKRLHLHLDLPHGLRAGVGDHLRVGVPELGLLLAAFTAYLLPLLLMIIVVVLASAYNLPELLIIISSVFALFVGFLLARALLHYGLIRLAKPVIVDDRCQAEVS